MAVALVVNALCCPSAPLFPLTHPLTHPPSFSPFHHQSAQVGDEVYGWYKLSHWNSGSYARYVAAPEAQVALKKVPAMSMKEAALIPVAVR